MRLELHASRVLSATLLLIGACAAAGLVATDLSAALAVPLAAVSLAWSGWLARAEARRPTTSIVLRGDGSAVIDGRAVQAFRLDWQGVLAQLEWIDDGRRRRRVAWPDVLDAAARRELRLWALGRGVRASTAAVAP